MVQKKNKNEMAKLIKLRGSEKHEKQ